MNILLTGGHSSLNNGEGAMVVSTVRMLQARFADCGFTIYSRRPAVDSRRYKEMFDRDDHVAVVGLGSRVARALSVVFFPAIALSRLLLKRLLSFDLLGGIKAASPLGAFCQADLVLDLSGDAFSDDYGLISTFIHSAYVLTAVMLEKRTIIFAQSMGPFRTCATRALVAAVLRAVDLVLAREVITLDLLRGMGIPQNRLRLTADAAFLLPSVSSDRVESVVRYLGRPLVGLNMSALALRRGGQQRGSDARPEIPAAEEVAGFADGLADELNCYIVLVPHRLGPGRERDDRVVLREVWERMRVKERAALITEAYTPMEVKSLIGQCDLFIGARMHSNIAALSQAVPTVAISYSHKTQGIMSMLDAEEWVYDIGSREIDRLLTLCKRAFEERDSIRARLEKRLPQVLANSASNGDAVACLILRDQVSES
jgi:colanic acid/amylovoran biosynthesis protein